MKRRVAVALLSLALVATLPATAQEAPPQRPMPRLDSSPNPADPAQPAPDQPADSAGLPKPPLAGQRDLLRLDAATQAACLATLRDRGVVYVAVAALVPDDDPDCGILQPVQISEIAPGVALVPPAIVRCPTAQAMAAWVQDFVLPAADRLTDRGALTAIENGSGYICRGRNNQDDATLSEHAFGNAFDVMGFRFEQGPPLRIMPRTGQADLTRAFQDAVWASACLDFTTVLGPGSNASHDDHLHLDIKARSSGFRICELGHAAPE